MTELSFLSRRDPKKATPDNELLGILGGFAQEWFGSLDVGLVAEHGVWVKEGGELGKL